MLLEPFKLILIITNFAILSFLVLLMIDHYNSQYNRKSFAFIFHLLCFIWLCIRGVFWLSTITISGWTSLNYYFLYWMPIPLEFGSFLLLPLYFAHVLYPNELKSYRGVLRLTYIIVIIGLLTFQAMYILISILNDNIQNNDVSKNCNGECFHPDITNIAFRSITAACFMLLTIAQAGFAIQLNNLDKQRYDRYITTSPNNMCIVNSILVCSFLTKSIYQLLAATEVYILPSVPLRGNGDIPLIVFIAFELWDYVPTILLISTITSRSVGGAIQSSIRNRNISLKSRNLLQSSMYPNYSSVSTTENMGDNIYEDEIDGNLKIRSSSPLHIHYDHIVNDEYFKFNSDNEHASDLQDQAARHVLERFVPPLSTELHPDNGSLHNNNNMNDNIRYWRHCPPSDHNNNHANHSNNTVISNSANNNSIHGNSLLEKNISLVAYFKRSRTGSLGSIGSLDSPGVSYNNSYNSGINSNQVHNNNLLINSISSIISGRNNSEENMKQHHIPTNNEFPRLTRSKSYVRSKHKSSSNTKTNSSNSSKCNTTISTITIDNNKDDSGKHQENEWQVEPISRNTSMNEHMATSLKIETNEFNSSYHNSNQNIHLPSNWYNNNSTTTNNNSSSSTSSSSKINNHVTNYQSSHQPSVVQVQVHVSNPDTNIISIQNTHNVGNLQDGPQISVHLHSPRTSFVGSPKTIISHNNYNNSNNNNNNKSSYNNNNNNSYNNHNVGNKLPSPYAYAPLNDIISNNNNTTLHTTVVLNPIYPQPKRPVFNHNDVRNTIDFVSNIPYNNNSSNNNILNTNIQDSNHFAGFSYDREVENNGSTSFSPASYISGLDYDMLLQKRSSRQVLNITTPEREEAGREAAMIRNKQSKYDVNYNNTS